LGNLQKEPKILSCFFSPEKATCRYVFILTKKSLGNCLGDFLTKSSGHPAGNPGPRKEYSVFLKPGEQ
jgi:hypothetical protein